MTILVEERRALPIVWRCRKCGAHETLDERADAGPEHAGCGGRWSVALFLSRPVFRYLNLA